MIALNARLSGDAAAMREIERLGRAMGKDAAETTRIIGRSVALFGVRESYPRMTSGKARQQGELAILRDARKVLAISPDGWAGGQEAYEHVSRYRGTRSQRSPGRQRHLDQRVRWVTPEAFAWQTERRQAMVGWGKAAWARAAIDLGAKAPPKWITRHTASPGYADVVRKLSGPVLTMGSRASYASDIFSSALRARAIRQGTTNAIRWMQKQVDGAVRKANGELRKPR